MKQVDQQMLNSVIGAFQMITRELSKPQEDVVAISVCGSTRNAIENVLKLYLLSKGVETKNIKNIDELVKACVKKNNKFQAFDFSSLNCRCESPGSNTTTYCLGEEKINSCYRLLVELKNFIFDELNINGNFKLD